MEEFINSATHHLVEIITNPLILVLLFIFLFGEHIPFTNLLWNKIGLKIKKIGELFFNYENKIYSNKDNWIENKKITFKINNYIIKMLLFIISTIITFLVELLWELGIRKTTKKLEESKLGIWAKNKIQNIPNSFVLLLFGLPFIIMEFVGAFSLTAIALGYIWQGILLYLFKMLFFIPVHFVLEKGKNKLLQIKWFKIRYSIIASTFSWFKKSQTYVKIHNILIYIKGLIQYIKDLINNRRILIKQAFSSNGNMLSEDCELIRLQIKEEIKNNSKAKLDLYKEFYLCIEKHINKDI